MEALLLREWYLLGMEARQVGHLAVKLRKVYESIYLVGEQYRFLLVYRALVCADLYEEVFPGYCSASLAHAAPVVVVLVHLRCSSVIACRSGHSYFVCCGAYLLASCLYGCCRDVEDSTLDGIQCVCERYRR